MKVIREGDTWYVRTNNVMLEMVNEYTAHRVAAEVADAYSQGRLDKAREIKAALYLFEEIYE